MRFIAIFFFFLWTWAFILDPSKIFTVLFDVYTFKVAKIMTRTAHNHILDFMMATERCVLRRQNEKYPKENFPCRWWETWYVVGMKKEPCDVMN